MRSEHSKRLCLNTQDLSVCVGPLAALMQLKIDEAISDPTHPSLCEQKIEEYSSSDGGEETGSIREQGDKCAFKMINTL